jgi:translation initiation factor RLI1
MACGTIPIVPIAMSVSLDMPGRQVSERMQNGGEAVSKVTPVPFAPTRIHIRDFGPVKEADIHLGKVTVLMGPNDTGKTYFTLLVPVLIELVGTWRFAQARLAPPNYTLEDFEIHLNKILYDILKRFYSVEPEELVRRGSES